MLETLGFALVVLVSAVRGGLLAALADTMDAMAARRHRGGPQVDAGAPREGSGPGGAPGRYLGRHEGQSADAPGYRCDRTGVGQGVELAQRRQVRRGLVQRQQRGRCRGAPRHPGAVLRGRVLGPSGPSVQHPVCPIRPFPRSR
jgi:hypothetical protein